MAEAEAKVPARPEKEKASEAKPDPQAWHPFEELRRQVDRLFDDFGRDFWRSPFRRSVFDVEPIWRRELTWIAPPAVDVADKEKSYEITAELPGLTHINIAAAVR